MNRRPILTQSQRKAMAYMARGHLAIQGQGSRVVINGDDVCTAITMDALERKGMVKSVKSGWRATAHGVNYLNIPGLNT